MWRSVRRGDLTDSGERLPAYVFDLWVHRWRLTKASGDMIVIRYADDTIVGFQHEPEARAFDDLKDRMRKFELALHRTKPG
jgi:RNA-directed DNA polymerase